MIIDIRQPSKSAIEGIEQIKAANDFQTNSQAVQHACSRYMAVKSSATSWRNRALEAETKLEAVLSAIRTVDNLVNGDGFLYVVEKMKAEKAYFGQES